MGKGSFFMAYKTPCFIAACIVQVLNYRCIKKIIYACLLLGLQNYDVKICVLLPTPRIGTQNYTKKSVCKSLPPTFFCVLLEIHKTLGV